MTRGSADRLGRDPGASAPIAPLGATIVAQLWGSLPSLLGANLVFLAWCLPYGFLALVGLPAPAFAVAPLTVGPGLVGLVTAAARLARGEPLGAWSASLRDARAGFRAGAVFATALLVGWHAQLAALRLVVDQHGATGVLVMWAAQVAVLVLGALVGVHALALVGLHGQGALEATRNAFIVAVRHPGPTVAMLGLVGAAGSLTWMLGGAPLVILPAALALALVSTTQHLIEDGGPQS
jgi:hypothetical protein